MKRRRGLLLFFGIFTTLVVSLGWVAHTSLRDLSFRERPFDSERWKRPDLRARGEMVASLQQQRLLDRKSRAEVLALLGAPDEDHPLQLRYRVDVGRRIAWKPFCEVLVITIDPERGVEQVVRVD